MRKISLIFAVSLFGMFNSNAQMLQFGVKGGVNFANYTNGEIEGVDFNQVTSYHFGLVTELKLLDNLSIQPELLYSTQGSELEGFGEQIKNELGYFNLISFKFRSASIRVLKFPTHTL